jgi:hypothetical protein
MGLKKGLGQLDYKGGDYYRGEFDKNKFEGMGKYYWKDENKFYLGNFE